MAENLVQKHMRILGITEEEAIQLIEDVFNIGAFGVIIILTILYIALW